MDYFLSCFTVFLDFTLFFFRFLSSFFSKFDTFCSHFSRNIKLATGIFSFLFPLVRSKGPDQKYIFITQISLCRNSSFQSCCFYVRRLSFVPIGSRRRFIRFSRSPQRQPGSWPSFPRSSPLCTDKTGLPPGAPARRIPGRPARARRESPLPAPP